MILWDVSLPDSVGVKGQLLSDGTIQDVGTLGGLPVLLSFSRLFLFGIKLLPEESSGFKLVVVDILDGNGSWLVASLVKDQLGDERRRADVKILLGSAGSSIVLSLGVDVLRCLERVLDVLGCRGDVTIQTQSFSLDDSSQIFVGRGSSSLWVGVLLPVSSSIVVVSLVEIFNFGIAHRPGSLQEGIDDGELKEGRDVGDMDGSVASMDGRVGIVGVGLDLAHVGHEVVVAPAWKSQRSPVVIVGGMSSEGHQVIRGGRSTQHLSTGIVEFSLVGIQLRHGLIVVAAVGFGSIGSHEWRLCKVKGQAQQGAFVSCLSGNAIWRLKDSSQLLVHDASIVHEILSRLQDQDLDRGRSIGQSGSDDVSGRPTTDNDEVEFSSGINLWRKV